MGVRDTIAKALMGMVGGPNKLGRGGIDVYHSSPHDFERFDWNKMGSGEGAQIRGKGFYFAEHPEVSGQGGQYWNQFQHRFEGPESSASEWLRQHKFDRDKALAEVEREIAQSKSGLSNPNPDKNFNRTHYEELLRNREAQRELLLSGGPVGPRTYEVNIKTDPDKLINLDYGIGGQSPYVQERLQSLGIKPQVVSLENTQKQAYDLIDLLRSVKGAAPWVHKDLDEIAAGIGKQTRPNQVWSDVRDIPDFFGIPGGSRPAIASGKMFDDIGADVHARLANIRASVAEQPAQMHLEDALGGPDRTAAALRDVQIPGSRYKDAGSTTTGPTEGTYNYVVNNPSILDIAKKYGVIGVPSATIMGSAFDQGQYRENPP